MMANELNFNGIVVAITGGARGIGRATALGFADRGAHVVTCDRLERELEQTRGDIVRRGAECTTSVLDVRDQTAVQQWALHVEATVGRVDVLINNAGGGFWAPFMDVAAKGQNALIAENFTQVADVTRAFVPLMGRGGSIINVTSIEAHRAGPGFGIYSAMKAAVENLTKTLSLELADRGIRVNAIAPDMIETPGDNELVADSSALIEGMDSTPIGRYGTPDDAVGPMLFLASPLSSFVTGSTIHLDGGTSAAFGWKRRRDDDRWML